MPGWYIHLDVARRALANLPSNQGAHPIFAQAGPSSSELSELSRRHPAYVALGAVGPDLFFLLPDFRPPRGQPLFGAAQEIERIYSWWDENFLGPYQRQLGPVAANLGDHIDAASGGVLGRLSGIAGRGMAFLIETAIAHLARQYDVFAVLGSGVPSGVDEKTFFWSDMLHYRRTYEFAAHLWKKATDARRNAASPEEALLAERRQAYALGWMTHLATDVTGHGFVNEKCGGPFRLHWQRHHLIENHMDAKLYDTQYGTGAHYPMISAAALHLWVAFKPDGTSHVNFFDPMPGPPYNVNRDTGGVIDRRHLWDVDSEMPAHLAEFLAEALRQVYPEELAADPLGPEAAHPTILDGPDPGSMGYTRPETIRTTYFWLQKYMKRTTTDYYALLRPERPAFIESPPFPIPPGAGTRDPAPREPNVWRDLLEGFLALLGWLVYLGQVLHWALTYLPSLLASAATYPVRELLYEYVEVPLYNAWQALHWYLAMTGFTFPMQGEISPGMVTLGEGVGDVWGSVQAALNDLHGGLHAPPTTVEPSGRTTEYPLDVVVDPPSLLTEVIDAARRFPDLYPPPRVTEQPSEYQRPWLWPALDNHGNTVPVEQPRSDPGPFIQHNDVTDLLRPAAGSQAARLAFESARSELDTQEAAQLHFQLREHLGDPVDYTSYVMARLTREDPGPIANFNLDADRGYGYLCWDWIRTDQVRASPLAYGEPRRAHGPHSYRAPLRPGAGWYMEDMAEDGPVPRSQVDGLPEAERPIEHDAVRGGEVKIRYIDRERK